MPRALLLTDTDGDTLNIQPSVRVDCKSFITIEQSGETAAVTLSAEDTEAAGRRLLELAGAPSQVTASSVSFNEGLMRLAAVHGKTVTFRYAKGNGSTIETRRLVPETVFTTLLGDVLFGGEDPDRDEYRAYRVDRIKGEVSVA